MKVREKSIEERFKSMSEKEHILTRPGMWVGSIKYEEAQQFIYDVDEAKMKVADVAYKQYEITSADGKKQYHRTWSNNMEINDDLKISVTCDHFTETKFLLDYDRFDEHEESYITEDFISIIEKRCIDAAAANQGLTTIFEYIENDKTIRKAEWNFKTFEEYIELYSDYIDQENCISFKDKQKQVWIYPDGGLNIGFVNGAECSKGTHIKAIRNEINNAIAAQILQKNKFDISPRNVDGKYTMFCIYHVANPSYNSQTKVELTTPVERFSLEPDYKFSIPDKFIKDCCKSEIVNIVIDWYKQKAEVEDQKTIRKLNKQAKTKVRSEKFIDANTKVRKDRELWLFEGASAAASFRVARNPQTQAAYLLRGKPLNTIALGPSKITKNQEFSDVISILGLQWGEVNKADNLNFGKIVLCTDADEDGNSICGLLLTFFGIHFPELFDEGLICRAISPIIVAETAKDYKAYYKLEDYRKEMNSLKGYKIKYVKGLGTLSAPEFKEMMQKPIYHYFTKDDIYELSLRSWFGKGNASERKAMLKEDVE